jgi:hypothetical protein
MIPEAYYAISCGAQPAGSPLIVGNLLQMLRAIEFDDQLLIDAAKIDNVCTDLMLSSELQAQEPMCSQLSPQGILGVALLAPKSSCVIAL